MRALGQSVDAGIGPARAMHGDLLSGNFLHGRLQEILRGPPVGLALPSGKGRAIIGNDQLQAHGCASSQLCKMI